MRYDKLDLKTLCPDGQPLNESTHVEKTGYINAFFLNGFEQWYAGIQNLALSFAAPYSLEACMACNANELQKFIEEAGSRYYQSNSHVTNATFAHALYTTAPGTPKMVDATVKYILDSPLVHGQVSYEGLPPHHYSIIIEGELETGEVTNEVIERITDLANDFAPVTEKLESIDLTETTTASMNVTNIALTQARYCEVEVQMPEAAPNFFFTINRTTGAETQGVGLFEPEPVPCGGTAFDGARTPTDQDLGTENVVSVQAGGAIFDGNRTPTSQDLGTSYFFTISKT